jgi:transcriptional regulator with XRE-family HTH domain
MNGALIKKWMSEREIRPEELAVKLGVSFSTVRSIMAGKKPSRPTVTVLASLMKVPEEELTKSTKKITGGSLKATLRI